MKAFWWFKENSIAGMARPGFNYIHWFDIPFEEAMVMGWMGQHPCGEVSIEPFYEHLNTFGPKVFQFYGMSLEQGRAAVSALRNPSYLADRLDQLRARTKFFKEVSLVGDKVVFKVCEDRLAVESDFLKTQKITHIVSLTEHHHGKDFLQEHFKVRHLGIEDMGAPQVEQAQALAEIVKEARRDKERVAVHCLAGIGRTSTTLIAAHMLLGESLQDMKALIAQQNPIYVMTGPQGDFLHQLENRQNV